MPKVIDLFSGVGGFSKGMENAGFEIVLANEIDKQIAISYKKNHKNTIMINNDIDNFIKEYKKLSKEDIEYCSNVDVIIGGPPCQGFSMAGARIRRSKSFIEDPRNFLFKKYFGVIQEFEPNFFIFENVVGLASMNKGAILKEIELLFENQKNFKKGRYYLQRKIFETDTIGVPQKRRRFIIIGSKIPFDLEKMIKVVFSKHKKFRKNTSIKDAISDLAFEENNLYIENQKYLKDATNDFQKEMRKNSKNICNHLKFNHSQIVIDRMKRIKQGENWKDLAEKNEIKSVHSGAYGRMKWDEKAMTITTRFDTPSAGRFIHPLFNRNITVREAARLQTFADDFIFYGNKTSICKQIGNAVPPYLGEFLGEIIKEIKNDINR